MSLSTDRRAWVLLAAGLAAALSIAVGCSSDDDPPTAATTPAMVESLFVSKLDNIAPLGEALQRTITHLSGTPQPGVNITKTATGGTGTVGVDLDDDGTQESTVTGTLTWNDPNVGLASGATLEITELTGNAVSFSCAMAVTGATQATFSNITALVGADAGRPQVVVSTGSIVVDASTSPPTMSGSADFAVGDLPATMVVSDNAGTPSIVVTGANFSFTVP